MPSKYTAYLHFSQQDMDALAKLDPSINENAGSINQVISLAFRHLIDGRYITKDQMRIDINIQNKKTALQTEKIEQEIINLKIRNKIAMVHDLKIAPEQANEVAEKRIPIEQVIGGTSDSPTSNVNAISPYDEKNNRLECIDCGILFEIKSKELSDLLNAQSQYLQHKYDKHQNSQSTLKRIEVDTFKKMGIPI